MLRKFSINILVLITGFLLFAQNVRAQLISPSIFNLFPRPDTVKKAVTIEQPARAFVALTPNPVFNNASLIIECEETGNISCLLYDAEGHTVRSYQFRKEKSYLQQILPMYDLPKGEYLLSVVGRTILESRKVVKQ